METGPANIPPTLNTIVIFLRQSINNVNVTLDKNELSSEIVIYK